MDWKAQSILARQERQDAADEAAALDAADAEYADESRRFIPEHLVTEHDDDEWRAAWCHQVMSMLADTDHVVCKVCGQELPVEHDDAGVWIAGMWPDVESMSGIAYLWLPCHRTASGDDCEQGYV